MPMMVHHAAATDSSVATCPRTSLVTEFCRKLSDLERTRLRTQDFLWPSPSYLLVLLEWSWMALLLNRRGTHRVEPRERQ
jgi:hypothetical protein